MASASLLLPLGCIFGKSNASNHQRAHKISVGALASEPRLQVSNIFVRQDECAFMNRRNMINIGVGLLGLVSGTTLAEAAGLPPEEKPKLCDNACEKELENDIQIGGGPSPPIGFQEVLRQLNKYIERDHRVGTGKVAANYVAMVPSGQIFDSSLEKGQVYIFRVGAGQVIKGLDEGVLSMKVGGKRRLYIPGPLAFPKGLTSAPGRPRVAANSPVIFDVSLLFIPGLDDEE